MTAMRADCARPLALELIGAVRSMDRQAVRDLLDLADLPALAVVLAAMVDEDRTERELLAWVPDPALPAGLRRPAGPKHAPGPRAAATGEQVPRALPRVALQPCGTHAAYARHKGRGEPVDEPCLRAEREYQRNRPGRRVGDRARAST